MSKRRTVLFLTAAAFFVVVASFLLSATSEAAPKPRHPNLIVIIVIDQFRTDYLQRFRPYFGKGGFRQLLKGSNFSNCRINYAATVTAPGHATLLTGTHPNVHGIIDNAWFDRASGKLVDCVADPETRLLTRGEEPSGTNGASPRRMRGETLGDLLRSSSGGKSKVVSVSLKNRGAILAGGHSANAAFWYDPSGGRFISSTYYMRGLPPWVVAFNADSPAKFYCDAAWKALPETPGGKGQVFSEFKQSASEPCPSPSFLRWLHYTPFVNDVELKFALEAVRKEELGADENTDLLTISLSANDYIGHGFGPDSPEVADMVLRTDRYLANFFGELDRAVGLTNVWIALSADHGVAPTPRYIREHRLGMGIFPLENVDAAIEKALSKRFGNGRWVERMGLQSIYLSRETVQARQITLEEAAAEAAKAAAGVRGVKAAFTRAQILSGQARQSHLGALVTNGFDVERSGEVFVILDPYAVPVDSDTQTTHGSPWDYDTRVPMLLWGSAFEPGVYSSDCSTTDLVPTLATALGITAPDKVQGRALSLALKAARTDTSSQPRRERDAP